jgi:hypothetical protein
MVIGASTKTLHIQSCHKQRRAESNRKLPHPHLQAAASPEGKLNGFHEDDLI